MEKIYFNESLIREEYRETIFNLIYVSLVNSFYDEFKEKNIKIVEEHNKYFSAQSVLDYNGLAKFVAVRRILSEHKQKNLESKTN